MPGLKHFANFRTNCWFLNSQNGVLFYRQSELLKFTDSVIGPICWLNHLVSDKRQEKVKFLYSTVSHQIVGKGIFKYSKILGGLKVLSRILSDC